MDSSTQVDQIRANPNWRATGARYDFVILNYDHNTTRCAQVMGLYVAKIDGVTYSLALIRMLGPLSRHFTTGYIHAAQTDDYRFEFIDSFVRSIFVHVPQPPHSPTYIINDLIDADMYYRLNSV